MSLTALRALDAGRWFSTRYAGVKVLTLFEVLDLGRTRGARFLVELKTRPTQQQMDAFLNRIGWLGLAASIQVRPWTVDRTRAWRRMATDKVEATITNRPKRYLSWARSVCS